MGLPSLSTPMTAVSFFPVRPDSDPSSSSSSSSSATLRSLSPEEAEDACDEGDLDRLVDVVGVGLVMRDTDDGVRVAVGDLDLGLCINNVPRAAADLDTNGVVLGAAEPVDVRAGLA